MFNFGPQPKLLDDPATNKDFAQLLAAFARDGNISLFPYANATNLSLAERRTDQAFSEMDVIARDERMRLPVALAACQALGATHDPRAVSELSRALDGTRPEVRSEATKALAVQMRAGSSEAADRLGELANTADPSDKPGEDGPASVDRAAIGSLQGGKSSAAALRALKHSKSDAVMLVANNELPKLKAVDNRLTEEGVAILEKARTQRIAVLNGRVDDMKGRIESDRPILTQRPPSTPMSKEMRKMVTDGIESGKRSAEGYKVKATAAMAAISAEAAKLSKMSPFDYGVALLGTYDRMANLTSNLKIGRTKMVDADEAASRFPLIRYNTPIHSGDGDEVTVAFKTTVVEADPVLVVRNNPENRQDEFATPQIDVQKTHELFASLGDRDLFVIKREYLKGVCKFPRPTTSNKAEGTLDALGSPEEEITRFFDLINGKNLPAPDAERCRRLVEMAGERADQAYEFFSSPATTLRSDAALEQLQTIAGSSTVPLVVSAEARKQLSLIRDNRATGALARVAATATDASARLDATKRLGMFLGAGYIPAAIAIGRVADDSTDAGTRNAARAMLANLDALGTPSAALWNYWKADQNALSIAAHDVLVKRKTFDDRLSEDDQLALATARDDWMRGMRNALGAAELQLRDAAKVKLAKGSRLPSDPAVRVPALKARIASVGKLGPVEFGAALLDDIAAFESSVKFQKELVAHTTVGGKTYKEMARDVPPTIDVEKVYTDERGVRHEYTETQINPDLIVGVVGAGLANAEAKRQQSASDALQNVLNARLQCIARLSPDGRKVVDAAHAKLNAERKR